MPRHKTFTEDDTVEEEEPTVASALEPEVILISDSEDSDSDEPEQIDNTRAEAQEQLKTKEARRRQSKESEAKRKANQRIEQARQEVSSKRKKVPATDKPSEEQDYLSPAILEAAQAAALSAQERQTAATQSVKAKKKKRIRLDQGPSEGASIAAGNTILQHIPSLPNSTIAPKKLSTLSKRKHLVNLRKKRLAFPNASHNASDKSTAPLSLSSLKQDQDKPQSRRKQQWRYQLEKERKPASLIEAKRKGVINAKGFRSGMLD